MGQPTIGLLAFSITIDQRLHYGIDATYVQAITSHGGIPLLIPPGLGKQAVPSVVEQIDGLIVPGGTDISPELYGEMPYVALSPLDPELEVVEFPIVRGAYEVDLPVLGICRGNQALAVALGGALYQDLHHDVGTEKHSAPHNSGWAYHEIDIEPGSRLGSILDCTSILVNSWHHQAIRLMPENLVVAAKSRDGVIEGIEAPLKRFFIGIQCHPEELWNDRAPQFQRLFQAFVEAAAERAADGRHAALDR